MPKVSYTSIFEKMLARENIEIRLNTDAKEIITFTEDKILFEGEPFTGPVIFTGAIDELFDCRYGRLPYRSLNFQFEYLKKDAYQPKAVVNYTVSEDYTRITEFKKLTGQQVTGTTIMKEYPVSYTGEADQVPYYAILNEKNNQLYEKYRQLTQKYGNMYLLGRLAEYKYYNIDGIVAQSLEVSRKINEIENEGYK
jgi:UDP-galactopyranose mutase